MASFDFNDMKQSLPSTMASGDGGSSSGGGGVNKLDRFYDIKVQVTGKSVVDPGYHVSEFKQCDLGEQLQSNIQARGFERPLPIQQYAIPYIEKGLDVTGHSITGSGKTAAYILSILDMWDKKKHRQDLDRQVEPYPPHAVCYSSYPPKKVVYPHALILVPTRELAIQIAAEFRSFSRGLQINTKLLYGGEGGVAGRVEKQMEKLRDGDCDILVATPGRLKNQIGKRNISMVKVKYFVLDEAEKMFDVQGGKRSFAKQVKFIVESGMPTKDVRQTLLFSATFPSDVQEMIDNYLEDDYVFISVGKKNVANSDITQEVIMTTGAEKYDLLLKTLRAQPDITKMRILIFVVTRKETIELGARLAAEEFSCNIIHKKMDQPDREKALNEFRKGTKPILVATSVAARGLDIKDLDLVINYSLPDNIREYVQRIGRTGRVGNKGRAIAFYDKKTDNHLAAGLVEVLRDASMTNTDQEVPEWLQADGRGDGRSF